MERFPIQYQNRGEFIPLGLMLEHEEQCLKNHHQSVQQLAKRGGTSYVETYYILNDSEYKKPRLKEMEELGRYEENARRIVHAKAYEYLMNNDLAH